MVKYNTLLIVTKQSPTVNNRVQDLDIAVGLKQLLIDASFTLESIVNLGHRNVSEMLHIDPYVGKLIVEAVQNAIQERNLGQDYHNGQ